MYRPVRSLCKFLQFSCMGDQTGLYLFISGILFREFSAFKWFQHFHLERVIFTFKRTNMLDDEKSGSGSEEETKTEGDGDGSDNKAEEKNSDNGSEGANEGESEKGKTEDDKKSEDEEFKDDGQEPAVRKKSKSNIDYILNRKNKKIEKLKEESNKKKESEEEGDDNEDDVDPEDREVVSKIIKDEIAPVLNPLLEERAKAEDDLEVNNFLNEFPQFKPFEARARRFMQHPSRKNLPIATIFMEAAGPENVLKIGAKMKNQADEKAKEGQMGGGNSKPSGEKKVSEMSNEEFAEHVKKVKEKG